MKVSFYLSVVLLVGSALATKAADWPNYLHDSDRSGVTTEQLTLRLKSSWVYESPSVLRGAWSSADGETVEGRDLYDRIRYDDAIQVAGVGKRVYFGSPVDHQVHCLDASTGTEIWAFFTGAPILLAPNVVDGRVYVGSDDGYGYCLSADSGELI